MKRIECHRYRVRDVLTEVTKGVGPSWRQYRLVGATRDGIAPAQAAVGKSPERYKPVHPGTVFYNPMRILIGSIAMIREGEPSGITSPDYVVVRAVEDKLDPVYFYYWLRSEHGNHFIKSHARGAVRERLTFARLADAEILVPPIDWQRGYATIMSEVTRARAGIDIQLDALNALPGRLLAEVFENEAYES